MEVEGTENGRAGEGVESCGAVISQSKLSVQNGEEMLLRLKKVTKRARLKKFINYKIHKEPPLQVY